jgi:hypothetical protein
MNIVTAVNLKEYGKFFATYTPGRAANMARHPKASSKIVDAALYGKKVRCDECGNELSYLKTQQSKRDELYCKRCDTSIPLYE